MGLEYCIRAEFSMVWDCGNGNKFRNCLHIWSSKIKKYHPTMIFGFKITEINIVITGNRRGKLHDFSGVQKLCLGKGNSEGGMENGGELGMVTFSRMTSTYRPRKRKGAQGNVPSLNV